MQPRGQLYTGADPGRRVKSGRTTRLRVRFLAALSLAAVLLVVFAALPPCPCRLRRSPPTRR